METEQKGEEQQNKAQKPCPPRHFQRALVISKVPRPATSEGAQTETAFT